MRKNAGFTLIEVLVASAMLIILLTSAVPSMVNLIGRHQVAGELNDMRRALAFARQHAVDTKLSTSVCAKDPAQSGYRCGTNWNHEKIVFSDINSNGLFDGNDEIVYSISGTGNKFSLSSNQSIYTFANNGTLIQKVAPNDGYATIKLCSNDNTHSLSRALFVYSWGKVALSLDTNGDGQYETPEASALSCT